MRSLLSLTAALLVAFPAFGATTRGAAVLSASGPAPFTATAPAPQGSANFGSENYMHSGTVNNGLVPPTGALYLPSTTTLSWTSVMHIRVPNEVTYFISSTDRLYLAASCTAATCSSGNDHLLWISSPASTAGQQLEINFKAQRSSSQLWTSPISGTRTGIYVTPGHDYCIALVQYGTDAGAVSGDFAVSVVDDAGTASTSLSTTTNNTSSPVSANFYYNVSAGSPQTQATIGDLFKYIGTPFTTVGSNIQGFPGSISNVAMFWGVMPNTAGTPTTATLKSLCGGQDIKTAALAAGFSIRSLYRLNDGPTWAGDPAGTITTAATTLGNGASASSPILPSPCLTLNEVGPYDIHGMQWGQSTGSIWFSGGFNAASCGGGGRIKTIQGRLLSGGSPITAWTNLKVTGSTFLGSIAGQAPGSTPYVRQIRIKNSPTYTYTASDPVYLGMKIGVVGQSQQCIMFSGGGTLAAGGGILSALTLQINNDSSTYSTNTPAGAHASLRRVNSVTVPGGGSLYAAIGDGMTALEAGLAAASGWPVQVVPFCRHGHPAEAFAYDYLPASQALTATSSVKFDGPGASSALTGTPTISGATPLGFVQTILKGSLKLTNGSGVQIAHDDGAGAIVGDNGATVSAYSLTYERSAGSPIVSATFSSAPTQPVTATWTSLQDSLYASYGSHPSYIGFSVWGDGVNPASGQITNVASRVMSPMTAYIFEQCTNNMTELASSPSGTQSGINSWAAKWDYVFQTRFPKFWWGSATTPVVAMNFPRDAGNGYSNTASCRHALMEYGGLEPGAMTRPANYYFGGSFWDDTITPAGPHEDTSPFGGQRMGRRIGKNLWTLYNGGTVQQPTVASAAFNGDYAHILITVNLPAGSTSLANCGTNLSGGVDPVTGTTNCAITSTLGIAMKGFKIGMGASTATATWYGDTGFVEGGSFTPANGFACTLASASTISCVKASGVWTSGQTFLTFAAQGPFNMAAGVVNYTIATAGSGYTANTSATLTGTGGTCATQPQVTVTTNGAGAIVLAQPLRLGSCTVLPTFPISGLGTPTVAGSVTGTLYTPANDTDDMGQGPYDNSGGFSGYEPGQPLRELIVPIGVTG